ncbi:MAG: sensor histidine kinase, partial [Pseudomonadota bacterium]
TMARFADGETESRGARGGVREVAELSGMFDDMAASLARQRQDQLAFLAGVAHDLKNPLGALKLGIQALERDRSESRRAKTRRRLERQVDFLARMVEDLLDATRIEAGQLEIRLEQLDVRDLVTDMAALYRGTAPERPIEVRVPETAVLVSGDPLRLEQVVSNLFSNALKFSPRGSPMWAEVAARNGEVVVEVTDRGMGIPPDEIDDVFKPFRRRMPDTAPGAGLGLSVVRRIVEAHGGAIEVESEPGAGSTFRVRLPRRPGTVGE